MQNPSTEYCVITGIKSHRPNPTVVHHDSATVVEAAQPEEDGRTFMAEQFDKDYAFNYTQLRWFRRTLHLGEEITLTADRLKMICDEVHEMGRLRERKSRGCDCPIHD